MSDWYLRSSCCWLSYISRDNSQKLNNRTKHIVNTLYNHTSNHIKVLLFITIISYNDSHQWETRVRRHFLWAHTYTEFYNFFAQCFIIEKLMLMATTCKIAIKGGPLRAPVPQTREYELRAASYYKAGAKGTHIKRMRIITLGNIRRWWCDSPWGRSSISPLREPKGYTIFYI
jgi:hypothetical protein